MNQVGKTSSTQSTYWKSNTIDDQYGNRDKNNLRFNEIDEDQDTKTWVGNNRDYNGLDWEPFGDTLDYPNNQAKPKVKLIVLYFGTVCLLAMLWFSIFQAKGFSAIVS